MVAYYDFCSRRCTRKLIGSEKSRIDGFYIEMNQRKQKWLISCCYNPNKSMVGQHEEVLSKRMDMLSSTYNNYNLL